MRRSLITAATIAVEIKSQNEKVCRPSELPIYSSKLEAETTKLQIKETPGQIETAVRDIRQTLTKYVDELSAYKRVGMEHVDRSIENLDCK